MAFDPKEFLNSAPSLAEKPKAAPGGFDVADFLSSSPLAKPEPSAPEPEPTPETPKEEPGRLEALARGLKQGASLGFGDELTGLVESIFTEKSYKQARDEARANDDAAKKAHGGYFTAGEIGGGLATAVVPGGLAVKGIAAGAKGAALAAGLSGAAQAVGDSKADLLKGEVGELAKDAAFGGVTGAALGGIAHKAIGKFVESAPQRYLKMFTKEMTEGATPTAAKTFANVKEIAPEIIAGDKLFMKAAKSTPDKAAAIAKNRLKDLGAQVSPIYRKVDQEIGQMPLAKLTDHFDREIDDVASKPGMEAIRDALEKTKDNFVAAYTRGGKDAAEVTVPTQEVRQWVTRLLKHNDKAIGQINEGNVKQVKAAVWETADDFLKGYLKDAAERAPQLASDLDRLSTLNKRITVWAHTEELMDHVDGRQFWKQGGLISALKTAGLPGVAALAGAAGGIGAAGVAGGAALAAQKGISMTNKAATAGLAKLLSSARAGNLTAQAVENAIKAGVPIGTVNALKAGIAGARSSSTDSTEE